MSFNLHDGSQPFFVPYEKRHWFKGVGSDGYLPALIPPSEKEIPEVKHVYVYEHSNISSRQAARIHALENNYSSLKKLYLGILDKKKVDKQYEPF